VVFSIGVASCDLAAAYGRKGLPGQALHDVVISYHTPIHGTGQTVRIRRQRQERHSLSGLIVDEFCYFCQLSCLVKEILLF
jgi:hypothetical protein